MTRLVRPRVRVRAVPRVVLGMKPRYALAALVVASASTATACDEPTGPTSDILRAEALAGGLVLQNRSDEPLYYFVYERETAALVLWGPCTRPAQCPEVPARGTTVVPYEKIGGYEPGDKEAIVYHWRLRPQGAGTFAVDSIRALVVQLD